VIDLFLSYHIGDISRIRNKDLRTLCSCNNLICLFSLCDRYVLVRSTLSFPTARSILRTSCCHDPKKSSRRLRGKCLVTVQAFSHHRRPAYRRTQCHRCSQTSDCCLQALQYPHRSDRLSGASLPADALC